MDQSTQVGKENPCQQVANCQGKGGQEAYSCLYAEMKENKDPGLTACRDTISSISQNAFKPMASYCGPEAVTYCSKTGDKMSYEKYECLVQKKNQNYIPVICKNALTASSQNLESLASINFPANQVAAKNPDYGFGAKPMKTGFSPSGSEIQLLKPKTGIR